MKFQVERWGQFYPECIELGKLHHDEIGRLDTHLPFNMDIERCRQLDEAGYGLIVTARDESKLVGYCTFLIDNSILSMGILCATQLAYFLSSEYRRGSTGFRLYKEAIKLLKERGVKNVFPHHWITGDSEKIGEFFKRLGAKEIQREYSLWIG